MIDASLKYSLESKEGTSCRSLPALNTSTLPMTEPLVYQLVQLMRDINSPNQLLVVNSTNVKWA